MDTSDEEVEVHIGKKFTCTTKDKTQPVKELTWTVVANEDHDIVDKRVEAAMLRDAEPWAKPKLMVADGENYPSTAEEMYLHMTPPTWLTGWRNNANKSLDADSADRTYIPTTIGEVVQMQGAMLAIANNQSVPRSKMWQNVPDASDLFPPPNLGRHGTTKNRTDVLYRKAHLEQVPKPPPGCKDTWWFADPYEKGFNEHRAATIKPGYLGTGDETACPWRGGEGQMDANLCPKVTVIDSKPELVMCELKTQADSQSNIFMFVEVQKGKDVNPTLQHHSTYGHTTATTIRMAKPFANNNSVDVADAWFGGVKTLYGNKVENGVDTICTVKTNTALLAYKQLKEICPDEHGKFITATAQLTLPGTSEPMKLMCIVIRRGPRACVYLGSCGTTKLEVPASVAYKNHTLATAPYLVPNMVNLFTKGQSAIDLGNMYRQHELAIEKAFITKCFATRLMTTFSGINFVDTFMAHMYFNEPYMFATKSFDFREEMNKLAYSLLHNKVLAAEMASKNPHHTPGTFGEAERAARRIPNGFEPQGFVSINGGPPSRESLHKHVLIPLSQVLGYKGCKQQRCMLCDELVSWVCARCTTGPRSLVPMHPFSTKHRGKLTNHGCLKAHRKNPTASYKDVLETGHGISKKSKQGRRTTAVFL